MNRKPKASPAYFETLPTVKHVSGYIFQQRGGRVYVDTEDEGVADTITSSDLQMGVWLTPAQLRKLAVRWMEDNEPGALR